MGSDTRMTVEAFAQAVGMSPRQIFRYIKSRQITPRRTPGGRPYFIQDDVNSYLRKEVVA